MINNSQGYVWKAIEKQELEDGLRLEVMVSQTVNLVKKKRERGYLSDKGIKYFHPVDHSCNVI